MKKCMLAVAIACAAVMSHAAQTNWQASGITDHLGTALASSTLGPFTATCAFYALDTGTGEYTDLVYTDSGTVNAMGVVSGQWLSSEGAMGNTTYRAVFTLTDKDGAYITAEGMYTSKSATSTINFANGTGFTPTTAKIDQTGGDSGWGNVTPVPEPTGGLLMLLGVAGLALRRHRA